MRLRHLALGMLPLALSAGCVSTTTASTTWGGSGAPPLPDPHGHVEWIRETVQQQQGNPAGGAMAGAVIGGLLGHALIGRSGGTLLGAVGGAAVGASESQGSAESRTYQVAVRFDDGQERVFLFGGYCPFRVADAVTWTRSGLQRSGASVAEAPYPPAGTSPPPPPAYTPPPPPWPPTQ
jgi:outer membrane lipoprotein SlyB